MKVVSIPIDQLVPYDKNPRTRGENAVSQVANSIKNHGFNQPIVVDQNNRICVGHTRYYAARELGLKEVPVFKKEMSEEKFIAYNLADNKATEHSDWDIDKLTDLFKEIDDDWSDETGFEKEEIDLFSGDTSFEGEDFEDSPEEKKEDEPKEGKGHVKMVQLLVSEDYFSEFMELVDKIKEAEEIDNLTDAVICAVKKYEVNKEIDTDEAVAPV